MPSTENNKSLEDCIEISLNNISYTIDVYDTPLGLRWIDALADNLRNKKILEKNFCFLGWPLSKRNLKFLVEELNDSIQIINNFKFEPEYQKINFFKAEDFQHSDKLPIGKLKPGLKLKHEACNIVHRYFEELQGTSWKLSPYYKQADVQTKYAIRQLNNICHEIETWVMSYRKYVSDPDWVRPSQITTFLNAPRKPLLDEDFEWFKKNRYNRELGGVYLHWSQVGKTLYEVYRDEGAPKMTDTLCSEVNHQKFYSGEFDIEWGRDICETDAPWHRSMISGLQKWLAENGFDWNDPKLALGYIKLGQINLARSFGAGKSYQDILQIMSKNLNITKIKINTENVSVECDYPYSLEDDGWKQLQIKGLQKGYESHSLR